MTTIYYVAAMLVCFHGECTRFESEPYSKDISVLNCTQRLQNIFQNQVGPYYDKIINFDVDKPEDIQITYAGCDKADELPGNPDSWHLENDEQFKSLINPYPNQNDLQWQQKQEQHIK